MSFFNNIPEWLSWLPIGEVPGVTAESVNQQPDQYTLIDVRSVSEFRKSHIPGALSIPLYKLSTTRIAELPIDKPFVCICLSAHRSKPATRKFIKAGMEAKELEGGMLAWWKANYPTERS